MEFKSIIRKDGRLTVLELPFNAKKAFNKPKGAIYVSGAVNGVPFRGKLLSKGNGAQVFIIDKPLQGALGYTGTDLPAEVIMEMDDPEEIRKEEAAYRPFEDCGVDVMRAIENRRSVRTFSDRPVKPELLDTVLHAGMCAPTAKNKRPFHFAVIDDRGMLAKLASGNRNALMLTQAACGIVVCADMAVEGSYGFARDDCAAAAQNMLLAIYSLGLGGVWCGVIRGDDWAKLIKSELKLPPKIEPGAVIALGYPLNADDGRKRPDRFDLSLVHHNGW